MSTVPHHERRSRKFEQSPWAGRRPPIGTGLEEDLFWVPGRTRHMLGYRVSHPASPLVRPVFFLSGRAMGLHGALSRNSRIQLSEEHSALYTEQCRV